MRLILAYSGWFCTRILGWCIVLLALALVLANILLRAALLYEENLADWASDSFGVSFSANIESAHWLGIRPEVFVSEVSLGTGDTALRVAEVTAEPDLLGSLFSLSLSWQELRLDGVELVLQELEDGGWQIAGIDLVSRGNTDQSTILEKMLLGSRHISVTNIHARLQFFSGADIEMRLDSAQIENSLGFHRLVVDATLEEELNQLQAIVELTGTSNRFQDLDGIGYAKFDGGDLTGILSTLIERYSDIPSELGGAPSVSGELWANIHSGSKAEFQGYLEITDMPGQIFAKDLEDLNFRSDISGHYYYFEDMLAIDFVEPDLSAADREWPLGDFRLMRQRGGVRSAYSLQMHRIDLEALAERVSSLYALPEKVISIIQSLSPKGVVENFELNLDSGVPLETLSVSADLIGVEVSQFRNAPAVRNLSGHLLANATSGEISVKADDLSLHYPSVYDWWLDHGSVVGTVGWQILPGSRFAVYGENIEAEALEGRVKGAFMLDSSIVPSEEGMDFYLNIGIQDFDAQHWSKFVPVKASESLRAWLQNAGLSGNVPSGSVIYRGKVKRGYQEHRTIQLRLQTEQASLSYLPNWPMLEDVFAEVFISDVNVSVFTDRAKLPGISIKEATAYLDVSRNASSLLLNTSATGATNSILDLVRHTGLRTRVGDSLDALAFSGQTELDLELQMPLKKALAANDVQVNASARLESNHLALSGLRLDVEDISGTLFYNDMGLHAEGLSAKLWQEPLSLSIYEERDSGVLNVSTQGQVSIASIGEWLDLDLLENLDGKTRLDGLLKINTDRHSAKPSQYSFVSDTMGIESNFPGTLSKAADEEAPFSVMVEVGNTQEISLEWSKGLAIELIKLTDNSESSDIKGGFDSAVLSLNAKAPEHQTGKFLGNLYEEKVEVESWLQAIFPEDKRSVSSQGMLLGLQPELTITTTHLVFDEEDYGEVHASLSSSELGWITGFECSVVEGSYLQPFDASVVPSLDITKLNLDELKSFVERKKQAAPDVASASEFDPSAVPKLDVSIADVVLNEASKGRWKAQLRPSAFGLSIENIECQFGSLSCADGDSSFFWANDIDGEYSALSLSFDFENISDMFGLADIESPITSKAGEFYMSVNWNGSPYSALESQLSGVLGVQLEDGEFLAQPNGVGAGFMRLVGLVNIDTWLRRLRLDFSDVSTGGTAYDELGGDFTINENIVNTLTPVYVELPSGKMLFDGAVDLNENEVDAQLVVTLPARQNVPWVAALVGGLPAAIGVYVVSRIFDEELDSLASVSYRVTGPLDKLDVKTERVFDATLEQ